MSVQGPFSKTSLSQKFAVGYGIGEEFEDVFIDQVIFDFMAYKNSNLKDVRYLLDLIILENSHSIEQARAKLKSEASLRDYLVNVIGASLLEITPIPYDEKQCHTFNFQNVEFACGYILNQEVEIPSVITSLMHDENMLEVVKEELSTMLASKFNLASSADYIRGLLLSKLFFNHLQAEQWVH